MSVLTVGGSELKSKLRIVEPCGFSSRISIDNHRFSINVPGNQVAVSDLINVAPFHSIFAEEFALF